MGCDKYSVSGYADEARGWKEATIHFSEGGSDMTCLCTMPQQARLELQDVRSLAYLGAAVVLQHHAHQDYWHLPFDIPEWIREEIDRVVLTRPERVAAEQIPSSQQGD